MTHRATEDPEQSRRLASIIGLAVGDAVGTTVEFMTAGTFTPLTDMVGGGPFSLPAGAWTQPHGGSDSTDVSVRCQL